MAQKRTRALLLVGHGLQHDVHSGEPLRLQALEIQKRKIFDEVCTAFWKEEPALYRGLDLTSADDVFVVPFFISSGFFTEQLVPGEMKLVQGLNRKGQRRIFYCEPVGTHPAMSRVVLHRVEAALEGLKVSADQVSLFVVGHGTAKNENSAAAIHKQVEALRALGRFAQVEPAFMEEEPSHKTILARAEKKHLVIVPFFIGDGMHSREDIPCEIGFVKRGQHWENPVSFQGKVLWYTQAVGSDPGMVDVILDRISEAEKALMQG